MTAILPVLVTVAGTVAYAISNNPKVSEMGRIAFAVGLLLTVAAFSGATVSIP